jgi:hypothetical protein
MTGQHTIRTQDPDLMQAAIRAYRVGYRRFRVRDGDEELIGEVTSFTENYGFTMNVFYRGASDAA